MERFLAKKADLREKVLDVGCGSSRFLRVGLDALKEWTGRSRLSVVYDSAVDGMTVCDMFQRVRGKRNVAVIGTTTAGDVFGGFYSVAMTREDVIKDPNAFVFSFKSHGRCRVPQRFVVKNKRKEGFAVALFEQDGVWTLAIGLGSFPIPVFGFVSSGIRPFCVCHKMSKTFEGIQETTLMGDERCLKDVLGVCVCSHLMAVALE